MVHSSSHSLSLSVQNQVSTSAQKKKRKKNGILELCGTGIWRARDGRNLRDAKFVVERTRRRPPETKEQLETTCTGVEEESRNVTGNKQERN